MFNSLARQNSPNVDNAQAARTIFTIATLLESQGANRYRVTAYRRAAIGLLRLPQGASAFVDGKGELNLPWLGPRLRRKLGELVAKGRMQFHQDLLAELPSSVRALLEVPGIGPKTAARLTERMGVRSVRGLARAAAGGELRQHYGFGAAREAKLGAATQALLDTKERRRRERAERRRQRREHQAASRPAAA